MASFTSRLQNDMWSAFIKLTPKSGSKFTRARCKKCSKEMSPLVKRMKDHLLKCQTDMRDPNKTVSNIVKDSLNYSEGQNVLCTSGMLIYEVKCLKVRTDSESGEPQYYVHYKGWKSRHDEWVDDNRLLQVNAANMKKMARLKNLHCKPLLKTIKKKPGRPLKNKTTQNETVTSGLLNKKLEKKGSRTNQNKTVSAVTPNKRSEKKELDEKVKQADKKTRPVTINRNHLKKSREKQLIKRKEKEQVKVNQSSNTKTQCFQSSKTNKLSTQNVVEGGPIVDKDQSTQSKTPDKHLVTSKIVDDPIIDLISDEENDKQNNDPQLHLDKHLGTSTMVDDSIILLSDEEEVIADTVNVDNLAYLVKERKEDKMHRTPSGSKYYLCTPNGDPQVRLAYNEPSTSGVQRKRKDVKDACINSMNSNTVMTSSTAVFQTINQSIEFVDLTTDEEEEQNKPNENIKNKVALLGVDSRFPVSVYVQQNSVAHTLVDHILLSSDEENSNQ